MVLIGGGGFQNTLPFLEKIVSLCRDSAPTILIMPTAGDDNPGAVSPWEELFGSLGASVESLLLIKDPPSNDRIREQVLESDAVFVPGGDTRLMMRTWRKVRVGGVFREALRNGVLLSGRSAGANCWFKTSIAADATISNRNRVIEYRKVRGLGFLDGALCTHYNGRKEAFGYFLQQFGGVGLGIDDGTALVLEEGRLKVHALTGNEAAYKVHIKNGWVTEEKLSCNRLYLIDEVFGAIDTIKEE